MSIRFFRNSFSIFSSSPMNIVLDCCAVAGSHFTGIRSLVVGVGFLKKKQKSMSALRLLNDFHSKSFVISVSFVWSHNS